MDGGYWNQLCDLIARRNSEVDFIDRQVRDDTWMFVHNNVTGEHIRIKGLVRLVVGQLDGNQSLDEILKRAEHGVTDAEKESLAAALISLSQLGAIRLCDDEEQERLICLAVRKGSASGNNFKNPLAIRIPLFYPDRLTARYAEKLRPLLGKKFLLLAIFIMVFSAFLSVTRLPEITIAIKQLADSPSHWWQMLVIYPLLKCVHELAHAISIRHFGGKVHEVGITLLVLMPIPYVDASDIWRLKRRRERIVVCASGMLVEGLVSACAFAIWCLVEPGHISNIAFVTAMLGIVSSLLFNANPLLKFDGYQILQDMLDIPNLAPRASAYLVYLIKRYLLQVTSAISPVQAKGERQWFVGYGVCALIYRWVITFGIAFYLIDLIPFLGALLASFALYQLAIKPFLSAAAYLAGSAELSGNRTRSFIVSIALLVVISTGIFVIPLQTNTRAEGIVWAHDQVEVFSPESAEIQKIFVRNGEIVNQGQKLLELSAPELQAQLETLEAAIQKLKITRHSLKRSDLARAKSLLEDIKEQEEKLTELEHRESKMIVRATRHGRVQFLNDQLVIGRFVSAGDTLTSVVGTGTVLVKTVISQSEIARLARGVNLIRIRLADSFDNPLNGELFRHVPAANRTLPNQSLAFDGHSGIAVASTKENSWQTVDPVFHVEVSMPGSTAARIGGKAYVRFLHEPESIGHRSARAIRQLLLKKLSV